MNTIMNLQPRGGVECVDVVRATNTLLGLAIFHTWRYGSTTIGDASNDCRAAAAYLRQLADWLIDPYCHAVAYGLYATRSMVKRICDATAPGHPLQIVIHAAWGTECREHEFKETATWHKDYAERCLRAAESLEAMSPEVIG